MKFGRASLLFVFLLTSLCGVVGASRADAVSRPDGKKITASEVDARVAELIQQAHVTGAGVAVFHNGKVVYLKAFGQRDVQKNLPLTPDSVMTAASLSKAAFAVTVLRLVQAGVLDLDKPVYEYLPKPLPDYPKYADLRGDERYKKITLRILLSHTSGFPNWRAFEDDHKLHIHFEPGTRYAYSGEGINLAQLVVETVTGKPLTDVMKQELFQPLHMTRSSMVWQPQFEDDFANGYDEYNRSLGAEKWKSPDAAGSMQTTLRDYATFLSDLMRGRILNTRTFGMMQDPQITIHSLHQFPSLDTQTTAANDAIRLRYGLGWGEYSSPYGKAFFKEGHDDGWRHIALWFRGGSGILIMTDSSNGEGIFKPLVDFLLGPTGFPFEWEQFTPYNLLPPLPKLKEHHPVALAPAQIDRLAGRYRLSDDVALSVTVANGKIFVQENGETPQQYLAEDASHFYSTSSDDECSFKPETGTAQVLVLHVDGKDIELKREP